MGSHFHSEVAVLLGGAFLCIVGAALAWQRRIAPGSRWFTYALVSCSIWAMTEAAEAASSPFAQKVLWSKLSYLGIATLPVFWFLFALRYQENSKPLQREAVPLFFLLPGVTIVGALTNEYHYLLWTSVTPRTLEPGSSVLYAHGPLFWVFAFYSYILLICGTIILARGVLQQHLLYRQQTFSILCGVFFPIFGNIAYLAGWAPVAGLDPTPFFFGICGCWLLVALSYRHLFDLAPIARDRLVESMTDALLVLDVHQRIVDINPAARALLGVDVRAVIGQPLASLSPALDRLALPDLSETMTEAEILLPGNPERCLNARVANLKTGDGNALGRMIVLSDVTDYKEVERELRHLNHRLRDQLFEINELKDRLQELANRDPLSGLYNRRYLIQMLGYLLSTRQDSVSLVMMDVDHFKKINDIHGHLAGDAVIQSLADLLQSQTAPPEFACRYGGEEFVVVLPGIGLSQAAERGEKWRVIFEDHPIRINETLVNATLSVGVATAIGPRADLEALLHEADTALYTAKSRGRNRVVVAPPPARHPGSLTTIR